jgi:hypothetical protein
MPQQRFQPAPSWMQIYQQHQQQTQQQQAESALQTALQQMRGQQGIAEQTLRGQQQAGITQTEQAGATARSQAQIAGQQKIAELGELGRLLSSTEITVPDAKHPANAMVNGVPLHKYSEAEHEGEKRESEFMRINKTMDLFDKLVATSPELQAMGKETLAQVRLGFIDPHISNIIQARGEAGAMSNAFTKQAALMSRLQKDPNDTSAAEELRGVNNFIGFYQKRNEFRQHTNNQQMEIFNTVKEPLGNLMSNMSKIGTKRGPDYMKLPFAQRLANDFDEATTGMNASEKGAAMMGLQHFGSFFHEANQDPFKAAMGNMLTGGGERESQPQQAPAATPSPAPQQRTPAAPGAQAPQGGTLDPNKNPFEGMALSGIQTAVPGGKQ